MFCWNNYTSEYNPTYMRFIISPCGVELFNLICFSSFVYILILLLIYVRWSPNTYLGVTSKNRLFYGHNVRYCLVLLLLLVQLIELEEYTVRYNDIWYIKLIPIAAIVSNVICQIFYIKLEEYNNLYHLIVTIIYWLSCGFCKALMFMTLLNLDLGFKHVIFSTSVASMILCYSAAVNDFISLLRETKRNISIMTEVDDETNERISYAYKHPFSRFYSKVTFYWLTSILHLGYVSTLEISHFTQLPESEKSPTQFEKFDEVFHNNKMKTAKNGRRVSLWKCFAIVYWKTFVFGGILKLIGDMAGLIPPLGISVVVRYIEMIQTTEKEETKKFRYIKWNEFINNGYVMAVVVFVSILIQGTLSQNSTHIINVEGIRLKNALQGLIYSKLLKIRKNEIQVQNNNCDNIGYITNLTTEDTYNVMSCFWIAHYVWAIPLKIVLLIYLLFQEIGISAVIGSVACIIVMLFLQLIIGKMMSKNYKSISEWSDKRLGRINEVLQGIRFIKLSCWEHIFTKDISNLRKNELKYLNTDSIHWTSITFLANTSSIIIAVVTLVLHRILAKSPIALSSLFTSLALFNQLTVPLFIFPVMVPIIISAVVSIKRIENFLSLPQIKTDDKCDREKKNNYDSGPITTGVLLTPKTKDTNIQNETSDEAFKKEATDDNTRLRKITENSENEDENKIKRDDNLSDEKLVLKINDGIWFWGDSSKCLLEINNLSIHAGNYHKDDGRIQASCRQLIFHISFSMIYVTLLGSLNVIIGKKGSGKTSFLCALLDNMVQHSGKIKWKKNLKFGYVPQSPWLLNDTVKENITFGYPYQEKHFARIVQMCALNSDINLLPSNQHTIIGGRGVALSGGQKQRLMIARMLYSKPDVVLLDDPFSSLDTKISNHIFENSIKKYLIKQNKTVIMTTSHKKFLPFADQIIVMANCKLKAAGTVAEIIKVAAEEVQGLNEQNTKKLLAPCSSIAEEEKYYRSSKGSLFVPLKRRRSTLSGSRYFTHDLPLPVDDCEVSNTALLQKRKRSRAATVTEYPNSPTLHRTVFRVSSLQANHSQYYSKKSKKRNDIEDVINTPRHQSSASDYGVDFEDYSDQCLESADELLSAWDMVNSERKINNNIKNYKIYIQSCGILTVIFYFILTFGWQIMRISADFWLSYVVSTLNRKNFEEQEIHWHLYLYVIFSIVALTLSLFSTALGQYAGSISRKCLHQKMLTNILKCPVQFFDNTSFGQVIDRFSTDVEIIDKKISTSTQRLIQFQLLCLSAIMVNCFITPWFIILVIPITLIYYMVQRFYRCSYRELQHLENFLRTPVINHFSETYNGLEVIRALHQQGTFLRTLFQINDRHTNAFLILNSSNRWLGIILDYLGGVIVFAAMLVSLISVTIKPTLKTSSFFGLAINYTLLIPIYLTWVVKFLVDLEIYMGAVERIHQYMKIPIEDYLEDVPKPLNWPQKGIIQFKNVTLRYTTHGYSVVQNINLVINSGQKVGICGRTGSGKSSLMMSLLKMVPVIEGEIILDGVNISTIPLQHLRSKVSIVPQDIILFNGTIRQNLDLKCEFSDAELWRCLKLVKISDTIASIGGLDAHVQDGGSNLSAGEKQLICLARAVLRESCCLILDEATNALQPEIETEFLNMILNLFENRSVVVITHRISSLLYFDRVLVLDNGNLVEDGSPKELMNNADSRFSRMIKML